MSEQRIHPATLKTERLTLRALQRTNASDIFEYSSNTEVTKFVFWNTHQSLLNASQYITSFNRPRTTAWGMKLSDENKLFGIVFLHTIRPTRQIAELAYNVSHRYWGRGFATEASERVLEYCFTQTKLNLIEGTCMTDHHASARVLEKVEFAFQEIKVKTRRKNGVPYDLKYFTVTRHDWERRHLS